MSWEALSHTVAQPQYFPAAFYASEHVQRAQFSESEPPPRERASHALIAQANIALLPSVYLGDSTFCILSTLARLSAALSYCT